IIRHRVNTGRIPATSHRGGAIVVVHDGAEAVVRPLVRILRVAWQVERFPHLARPDRFGHFPAALVGLKISILTSAVLNWQKDRLWDLRLGPLRSVLRSIRFAIAKRAPQYGAKAERRASEQTFLESLLSHHRPPVNALPGGCQEFVRPYRRPFPCLRQA